ncbi:MAG: ABC transporter substrate-binding protein [Candidatus Omnitrophota bacterium]|jgi:iron complex transport system substrate-binding protein
MKLRAWLIFCAVILACSFAWAAEKGVIPERIVSLSPVITEELFLLGAGDRVVGRTHYCTKPREAQKIEEVGNVLEVSVEKIVALRPDLVLAGSMTSPKAKEKLKRLGLRVEEFPSASDFNGICDSFFKLGRIIGKEKEAETMVKIARSKVDALRSQVRDGDRPAVFLQVGVDPLVTMTHGSFLNDLIEFSGGVNVARDAGSRIYSREKVIADDPDIIIISGMGSDGEKANEKEKKIWQGYRNLKAVKNSTIYVVDSDLYCAPTPLTFVNALENIIRLLHPHDAA